jgi:GDPmannose 4,6-dehydratase
VRQFIAWSAEELGVSLRFEGQGEQEVAIVAAIEGDKAPGMAVGDVVVRVDPRYFRPTEVETLLGDSTRAKVKLGWEPEISAQKMCAEMVICDLDEAKRFVLLMKHGFNINHSQESF